MLGIRYAALPLSTTEVGLGVSDDFATPSSAMPCPLLGLYGHVGLGTRNAAMEREAARRA